MANPNPVPAHHPRHGHAHGRVHAGGHGHSHDRVDPSIAASADGVRAVKWSFVILIATAAIQFAVVAVSGSVALLADTIHNLGDAATAVPLWVAFVMGRRQPSRHFTYGYGRIEDLAGLFVLLVILASAVAAAVEAIDRLFHPYPVTGLAWVALAAVVGFAGNEGVAVLRIGVGRRIDSAALVADGYHARADGLTSLAVVAGAAGVWLGIPLADPIVGLAIAAMILAIAVRSGRTVLLRLLDGVEPGIVDRLRHAASRIAGVERVAEVRARWSGHRLEADVAVVVSESRSMASAAAIAAEVVAAATAAVPALSDPSVRLIAEPAMAPAAT